MNELIEYFPDLINNGVTTVFGSLGDRRPDLLDGSQRDIFSHSHLIVLIRDAAAERPFPFMLTYFCLYSSKDMFPPKFISLTSIAVALPC